MQLVSHCLVANYYVIMLIAVVARADFHKWQCHRELTHGMEPKRQV